MTAEAPREVLGDEHRRWRRKASYEIEDILRGYNPMFQNEKAIGGFVKVIYYIYI